MTQADATQERRDAAEEVRLSEIANQDSALFKLLASSLAPYKRWVIAALVLMTGVALLNAVPPYLLQVAIDGPIAEGDVDALWRITIIYGATAFGIYLLTYAFTYFLQHAGQRALADLRSRLFNHILGKTTRF